ncbi:uncharacterized protein LOC112053448 isoform X1 [Bicyclus anynana]|uniref:Regulatory protein zeste n=1 Tax=Bicyclus anynana TaxID=110368 RepID=A0A6J1NV11_BICAN|nr:uncharacterized protein LOC112053448 isoform X1 [Bicyclus anynana]
MSRSYVPTQEQIEILVDFIERRRWLATGHARTTHARQRTRTAWQDIAQKLNRVECGCRKTWQQWAKYWKDKKGAIKRKVMQMRTNRTQTGDDGSEEVIALSTTEKRMVALIGGKVYAISNKGEDSDPFTNFNIDGEVREETKPFDITFLNDPPAGSDRTDYDQHMPNSPELPDEKPSIRRNSRRKSDTPTPRRHRLTTPSPHSQCQMVDLTERIIAIEERRAETERIIAQSQQELVGVLRQMSEAWTIQSAALKELVSKLSNK